MIFEHQPESILIKSINKQISKCQDCKNHNTKGGAFTNTKTIEQIDVVFIAQNPSKKFWNVKKSVEDIIPFNLTEDDAYHKFFDMCFIEFKIQRKRDLNMYVTNLVKCCTIDNTLKDKVQIDNCISMFLSTEISTIVDLNKNAKLVLLGNHAKQMSGMIPMKTLEIPHPGFIQRYKHGELQIYVNQVVDFILDKKNGKN